MNHKSHQYLDNIFIIEDAICFGLLTCPDQAQAKIVYKKEHLCTICVAYKCFLLCPVC